MSLLLWRTKKPQKLNIMKNNLTNRKRLPFNFSVGIIWLTVVFLFAPSVVHAQGTVTSNSATAATNSQVTPPKLETTDQVKDYMRACLNDPMPIGYITPDYISAAGSADQATYLTNLDYPEFYLKEGSLLLTAVQAYPVRYKEFIIKCRAIRAFYIFSDPSKGQH